MYYVTYGTSPLLAYEAAPWRTLGGGGCLSSVSMSTRDFRILLFKIAAFDAGRKTERYRQQPAHAGNTDV